MNLSMVFKTIVYLSFMGSIFTIIIILVKQLFKNKLSAKWHYYIWILLIVRLAIPYVPQSNFSIINLFSNVSKGFQFLQVKTVPESTTLNLSESKVNNFINNPIKNYTEIKKDDINENITENSAVENGINKKSYISKIVEDKKSLINNYLSIIWAAGIFIIGSCISFVNIRIHRITNKMNRCNNSEINKLLEECKLSMNIKSNIPIVLNKYNKAPCLLGFFRPKIIISLESIDKLSMEEIKYIFLHELSHLKKKDILINWIIILVQVSYWFNPVIWYAFHKMKQDCEISCDENVLNYINPKESINYAQAILNLAKIFSNSNSTLGVKAIVNKSETKRRIMMISKFNKKSKRWSIAAITITLAVAGAGFTNSNETVKAYLGLNIQKEGKENISLSSGKEISTSNKQKSIINNLVNLVNKNASVDEVSNFVEDNISKLSKENASLMICKLEEYQKNNLIKFEEEFYSDNDVQIRMNKVYKSDFDINKIDYIQDKELKDLLVKVRNSGYKIETAEGTYFPVLNYEIYKNYSNYVSEDLKDYIEIMAVESNNTPAKDAAIMISWDELLQRALKQEEFINKYKNSIRVNEVKELYKKYTAFALYGANNTPNFDYNTKTLLPEVRASYIKAIKEENNSKLLSSIKGLVNVLEKSNYKLTDDVESYRKNLME